MSFDDDRLARLEQLGFLLEESPDVHESEHGPLYS
jgi:hypothetical protein